MEERVPGEIKIFALWSDCEVVWFKDREDPLSFNGGKVRPTSRA